MNLVTNFISIYEKYLPKRSLTTFLIEVRLEFRPKFDLLNLNDYLLDKLRHFSLLKI